MVAVFKSHQISFRKHDTPFLMYNRLTIREPCMKRLGNARHHLGVGRRKSFFFTGVEILCIMNQQFFRTVFC